MSIIPVEVPTGAIRHNTDSNKMECFNGTKWMQIAVSSPDLDGGARGFHVGGRKSPGYAYEDQIDAYNIASTGSVFDFGDLPANITSHSAGSGVSNSIRAVRCAGYVAPTATNRMDYVTIATTGNASDFGDMIQKRFSASGFSDSHGGLS